MNDFTELDKQAVYILVKLSQSNDCTYSMNKYPIKSKNRKHQIKRFKTKRKPHSVMQTLILEGWLMNNWDNPYPKLPDKYSLAQSTKLTLKQIESWFANCRRRNPSLIKELSWISDLISD